MKAKRAKGRKVTVGERLVATYVTGCSPGEMRGCYIPNWKRTFARRIDAAIARAVTADRKARKK